VLLLCAFGLVVALACANLANLRLAQAAIAARDVAICTALGASRWRTTRAFLVENLLLAESSATLGIGLPWGGVRVLAGTLPRELPRVAVVAIDLRVLGVAVLGALVTGLLGVMAAVGPLLVASESVRRRTTGPMSINFSVWRNSRTAHGSCPRVPSVRPEARATRHRYEHPLARRRASSGHETAPTPKRICSANLRPTWRTAFPHRSAPRVP
jgi:hypothetical protein